jgi:PKD repeat protein
MSEKSAPVRTRLLAGGVALLVAMGGAALLSPGTALADSKPATVSPANPVTAAADALPTVQINGVAWSQAVVGNTVYVAGAFTSARPAGAAAGTSETPRANLLAYDIRTGALITSFAPVLNGQALVVTASPDGSRIYIGGDFTTVNGQARKRVAALDTATGALVSTWKPSISSQVKAIAATNDTVYLGGTITGVGSVARTKLAAVTAATGALLPWAPVPGPGSTAANREPGKTAAQEATLNYDVLSLVVTGGGSQVVAAGRFDTMNGVRATGVAALDPVTGANRPFAINQKITNQGINSAVYSLTTDGTTVFGTAYDYYGPGNIEGSFAVTADGGKILAVNTCLGDTYSSFATGGVLYLASHEHNCASIGGFPEQPVRVNKFATAMTVAPTQTLGSSSTFSGSPGVSQLNWFPTMTAGTYTKQGQAGWSVSGTSQYVVYGGEFLKVNGTSQQGLVRFAMPGIAPNKVAPTPSPTLTPVVTAPAPGVARVRWTATSDMDNEDLTYRVYRDGAATPAYTKTQSSRWYDLPAMAWDDLGVSAGTHSYKVTVTDPFGNKIGSTSATSVTVPAGSYSVSAYAAAVRADGAQAYWPLGESTRGTALDLAGAADLTVNSGVTTGATGALAASTDKAYRFDGSSGLAVTTGKAAAPNTVSEEAWFRTSSRLGGKVLGFGTSTSGLSTTYDRHVYLDTSGRVLFGVYANGAQQTLQSGTGYNDGAWHHVVAELSPAGMELYLDGVRIGSKPAVTSGQSYTGYFRVGGDRSWTGASYFAGDIDEVALYPAALPADRVANHHSLGRTGKAANLTPTASFGATVHTLTATVDGSASSDPDGTVAGYAWDFGDGSTGTGAKASHRYAAGGSYTVTLTVTDGGGATATTSRSVTVVPNVVPTAAITSSVSERTVALDASASSDTDGTVTGYGWDFGDGSTGSGRTAQHTYAADGTYPVVLTVTDDDGGTATARADVTVQATVVVAADAFDRTVAAGLGTADTGGSWTAANGSTRQSVAPGTATLRLDAAGNLTGSYLGGVAQTSADVRTSVALSAAPTGGGASVYVTGRRVGVNQEYRARLRFLANGTVGVTMSKLDGSSAEALIGAEVIVKGLTYTPGTALQVRVQVSGTGTTQLAATVWQSGSAEPATPTLTRTDGSASLQAPGGIAISAYLSGSATAPLAVRFGTLYATQVR